MIRCNLEIGFKDITNTQCITTTLASSNNHSRSSTMSRRNKEDSDSTIPSNYTYHLGSLICILSISLEEVISSILLIWLTFQVMKTATKAPYLLLNLKR